jgi:hypothetical protein
MHYAFNPKLYALFFLKKNRKMKAFCSCSCSSVTNMRIDFVRYCCIRMKSSTRYSVVLVDQTAILKLYGLLEIQTHALGRALPMYCSEQGYNSYLSSSTC